MQMLCKMAGKRYYFIKSNNISNDVYLVNNVVLRYTYVIFHGIGYNNYLYISMSRYTIYTICLIKEA